MFSVSIEIIFINFYEVFPTPFIGNLELSGDWVEVLGVFTVHLI